MVESNFDFSKYFEKTKHLVWNETESMSCPDNFYSILEEKVPYLLDKIEKAKKIPNIDEYFIKYLKENLEVNHEMRKYYKHTPCWYLTKTGKESFVYASPEIKTQVWINFKLTLIWIKKLETDFNCVR